MITSKRIEKLVAVIVCAAVVLCMLAVAFSDSLAETLGASGVKTDYENKLFDTSQIISINIIMDDAEWNEMLENAINEEYYQCDAVINGTTFYSVGIRPKGNTSLSNIVNDPTTSRYSFKLEFDYYVDGQTCFGLDKLVLNNNYADATNMKEALVYDMFQWLGADSSLYNYADISVNGETWGVYLALEAVEDSFMLRNFGTGNGNLYKPDSMNFGGAGGMKDLSSSTIDEIAQKFFASDDSSDENEATTESAENSTGNGRVPMQGGGGRMPQMSADGEVPQMPTDGEAPQMPTDGEISQTPNNGENSGRFSQRSSSGSALNYIDDDVDSYSDIWEGEVTSTGTSDHKRVVEALKNISEQTNVEEYLDVDNMLKYLAVHTFAVNLDSLSGSMTHNYYLYEKNGQLNLIPWDYNLAFGGFNGAGSSGASGMVNFAIDTPFSSGISLDDRQIFAALLENENYLNQYHEYLKMLCEEYIDGGRLSEVYSRIRSQIDNLVANDPNAFYSYEEYDVAAETLREAVLLRAQSVKGQLDGSIPSTADGQAADPSALIDASSINLSVLGTMGNGGAGDKMNRNHGWQNSETAETEAPESETDEQVFDNSFGGSSSPLSSDSASESGNTPPELQQGAQDSEQSGGEESSDASVSEAPPALTDSAGEKTNFRGGAPADFSETTSPGGSALNTETMIWFGISLSAAVAAIIAAKLYRHKRK